MTELLAGFPVVVELPVVWGEMDAMRHVNNVVYFRYFETARIEYCRRLDWYDGDPFGGIGPILASTEARFRKPLTYPDKIWVGAQVPTVGEDRFTMLYKVVSAKLNAVATEGQGVIVAFDYQTGTKARLPDELRQRIERLEGRLPAAG
jgi:acyl-CoA thioester hydrolase